MINRLAPFILACALCAASYAQQNVPAARPPEVLFLGQVTQPGTYTFKSNTTILNGLVEAGGFAADAAVEKILIVRGDRVLPFNYREAVQGTAPAQNILLLDGDIVIVKKRP